jgi:hypothetical protein
LRAYGQLRIRVGRAVRSVLQPFSTGGVYVKNLGDDSEQRVKAALRGNFGRFAEVKNRYDPENLFRGNQNERPDGAGNSLLSRIRP